MKLLMPETYSQYKFIKMVYNKSVNRSMNNYWQMFMFHFVMIGLNLFYFIFIGTILNLVVVCGCVAWAIKNHNEMMHLSEEIFGLMVEELAIRR